MKKILLITEYFWPEEFVIGDLAADAVLSGYEIDVLTLQPSYPRGRMVRGYRNQFFSQQNWKGVNIFRLKTILGYRESLFYKLLNYSWFAVAASIVAFCLRKRYDHVLIYQVGPLTMAIPGIVYGKSRGVPVAVWTQDVWPDSVYAYGFKRTGVLSRSLDFFVRWVYASVDTIFISCKGFERILKVYTNKPMYYAPNWPLTVYEHGMKNARLAEKPVFLFAGNIGKVQNLDNVIRGFAIACSRENFKGKLRIVGDGSALVELKQLADTCCRTVEFVGRKPSSIMAEEYRRASFLILSLADKPVFRLTVPSKFQMYVSVGKPILCAAEGEVRALVREFDLGVDADSDSPESIAEAFLRLSTATEKEIDSWGNNAARAFSGAFDRKLIVSGILATIAQSRQNKT
ncbi:MAG: hypothetical protein A2Z96_08035 [Spirochaetes bacterium GWB1_48_6]|nr:MAG: hypothetical protein A2Z96_08035 [Spirochaetes bacterium GWB1_48_6]